MNPYINFIKNNKIHIIYIIGLLYMLFFNPLNNKQKEKDNQLINGLKERNSELNHQMDSLLKVNLNKSVELKKEIEFYKKEADRVTKDNIRLRGELIELNKKKNYIIYEKETIKDIDSAINVINKLYN